MARLLVILLATFLVEFCHGASLVQQQKKSIDEIIMEATSQTEMFDTLHMMPSGELMVMVDLDLLLSMEEYMHYKGHAGSREKRKAWKDERTRWEDCHVYYEIDNSIPSARDREIIAAGMQEWEKYTCLRFEKADSNTRDKIRFRNGDGCYSRLGKVGGTQDISLGSGCVHLGVVIHEIGHAIGWIHEQARPDRDAFIRVNFNRIPPSWHPQFEKFPERLINYYNVPYDYRSIMHYSGNAVVARSIETLDPKYQNVIGQREGLSYRDVKLANLMYECAGMNAGGTCSNICQENESFLDKDCQCMCPGNETHPAVPCENAPTPTTTTPAPTTTTRRPEVSTTAKPEPMECRDLRADCASRAKAGECSMNPGNMMMFCMKSCDFCDKDACMDYENTCQLLQLGGFCNETSPFYSVMQKRCRKSCGFCTPIDPCQLQAALGLEVEVTNTGFVTSPSTWTALSFVAALLCLSVH